MRHQATIKTALMLAVFFLVASAAAEARPVRYDDILAMASMVGQSGRPSVDLRLRSQVGQSASSTQTASSTNSGNSQGQKSASAPDTATTTAPATRPASLTGTEVAPPQASQEPNVETVDLGEVQGTICDCGPIHIPGGFPKWPLIGLGAIPFFFIHEGCQTQPCEEIPPPPTPTPPAVPEPATIFLFGTGLIAVGAGARRRYARSAKNDNAREVRAS